MSETSKISYFNFFSSKVSHHFCFFMKKLSIIESISTQSLSSIVKVYFFIFSPVSSNKISLSQEAETFIGLSTLVTIYSISHLYNVSQAAISKLKDFDISSPVDTFIGSI